MIVQRTWGFPGIRDMPRRRSNASIILHFGTNYRWADRSKHLTVPKVILMESGGIQIRFSYGHASIRLTDSHSLFSHTCTYASDTTFLQIQIQRCILAPSLTLTYKQSTMSGVRNRWEETNVSKANSLESCAFCSGSSDISILWIKGIS